MEGKEKKNIIIPPIDRDKLDENFRKAQKYIDDVYIERINALKAEYNKSLLLV